MSTKPLPRKRTPPPAPVELSIQSLIEDYLADCRARGLSPTTVTGSYGYPLKSVFLPWCRASKVEQAGAIDQRLLTRFAADLHEKGGPRGTLSRASIDTYARAVNQMLAWAEREYGTLAAKAPRPSLPRKVLDVLTRDEIDRMEDVAKSERDKLVIRLLADTGMRAGELTGLKVEDLREDGRARYVKVRGKGAQERLVPVAPPLFRRLERLGRSRPAGAEGTWLFVALREDRRGGYPHLTPSGVRQVVEKVAQMAGITKRTYPHLLRHSFATEMLNRGVNPITLARQLGHSSLTMIQRVYSHQTASDVHDEILRALVREG